MKKTLLASFIIISFIGYAFIDKFKSLSLSLGSDDAPLPTRAVALVQDTPVPTDIPTRIPVATAPPQSTATPVPRTSGQYKDGTYNGDTTDAYYGNVQVKIIVSGGKISNVVFLDHPQDRGQSIEINNYAMPLLTAEAVKAQNANVDIVSGATATSQAFIQSLQSAINKAKA